MTKVHAAANKGETRDLFAMCASRSTGKGTVVFNGRRDRHHMTSRVVSAEEFKNTIPDSDRCMNCCDVILTRRNAQRLKKGKAPVTTWNE